MMMISMTLAILMTTEPQAAVKLSPPAPLVATSTPGFRLVEPRPAFVAPMFRPLPGIRTAAEPLVGKRNRVAEPDMNCTVRILKGDPSLDRSITRDAPKDLDPKIVQRSRCADPDLK